MPPPNLHTFQRACIASILRLASIVRLARTKDYTYVKAQCAMWAYVSSFLLHSAFPIHPPSHSSPPPFLPPLLQNHPKKSTPLTPHPPFSEAEITGGLICSCIVVLPRFFQDVLRVVPYSYPAPSRGKWVQMDGRKKSVPTAGWDESRGERALDEAVQGVTARPMEGV